MAGKILLVDDEEGIRKVLGISLEDIGYEVYLAPSGEEALQIFKSCCPSIVLTDIKMPGMDGIELLQRIKEESPATEVIMITGHGDLDLAIKSLQFEAADFVTKPINDEALEIALKRAHERIWMRKKLREYTENLERLVDEKTQKLLEAERLAAIGQTVATLAHAIKNIIGGLKGGMYVLEKGMELDNRTYLSQGWDMVRGNVDKIKNLALDLLSYAKEREPDYELCDPNVPLREVVHLMESRARDGGVNLTMELAEGLHETYLDSEGIHTCLLNLVTNALDACADMQSVNKPGEVVVQAVKCDGWAVEYRVSDNGCGMDQATKEKVFRTFFSTKGSRGTGLGLMITRKIVHEHGGVIELESEKGKGTRFIVRLPERS
jgi:signal transduction histidine kinase